MSEPIRRLKKKTKKLIDNRPVIFRDTFTEPIDTLLTSHTPDIGDGYMLNKTINANGQVSVSQSILANLFVVGGSGFVMAPDVNEIGPFYDIGVTRCRITPKFSRVATSSTQMFVYCIRYDVSDITILRGPTILINNNSIRILSKTNAADSLVLVNVTSSSVVTIVDDGTANPDFIKIYLNGVLVLKSTIPNTDITRTHHAFVTPYYGTTNYWALDTLHITEL